MVSTAFFALTALAASGVNLPGSAAGLPPEALRSEAAVYAREVAETAAYRTLDPTLSVARDLDVHVWTTGRRTAVRLVPLLPGPRDLVPVEGADRTLQFVDGELGALRIDAPLHPTGAFILSRAQTVLAAARAVRGSLVTDEMAARATGLSRPIYLALGDLVRAAYKVRIPALRIEDAREVYVDAETGGILLSEPVARTQATPTNAQVFLPAPSAMPPFPLDPAELVTVDLADLIHSGTGGHLEGYHFTTSNCCKYYTCASGGSACGLSNPLDPGYEVAVADRVCAEQGDPGAIESKVLLQVPPSSLVPGATDPVWIQTVSCEEQPRLVSTATGWNSDPVDSLTDPASEIDAFVESQTYYHTQIFFEHMRTLIGPSFCLTGLSMQCEADGSATLDVFGKPVLPFHIRTNFLVPDINLASLESQYASGLGRAEATPVEITSFDRIGNAAFIPALDPQTIPLPPELTALTEAFSKAYDSNLYMQGDRDFGYDGDIVYHEFTHAVVYTLKPSLRSFGLDGWGSHAFPGSLNEGWADYFSGTFTNDSLIGEYAAGGLRDLNNSDSCPTSLIGEVHQDSLPWSGALWGIRAKIAPADQHTFDTTVLHSITDAAANETHEAAAANLLSNLGSEPTLAAMVADAQAAFEARGVIGCERFLDLSTPVPRLEQPSKESVGLANYAPSVAQFRLPMAGPMASYNLMWSQQTGGTGTVGPGGDGTQPDLAVLAHRGRIVWQTSNASAVPMDELGIEIPFDPTSPAVLATTAAPANGLASASYEIVIPDPCNATPLFVSLANTGSALSLTNISATGVPYTGKCSADHVFADGFEP